MTQLGAGMTPMMTAQEPTRIVLQDGSAEAVARFCSEAMAVLQQISSVASSLGASAGALAAAATEVASNQRRAAEQTNAIIQNLGSLTRLVDQCCQMMSTMDMTPTVNVTPAVPDVHVDAPRVVEKTAHVTSRDSQGRISDFTIRETTA